MKSFITFTVLALIIGLISPNAGLAKSPVPQLNLSNSGLALRGYDPVAYFTLGKPTKGKRDISVKNSGGTYYFASQNNKDRFLQNPTKFLPQYGGYCAYGTAVKNKVDGDPRIWHIVNGKLYFNITRSVDRTWKRNTNGYIKKANRNWPKLKNR